MSDLTELVEIIEKQDDIIHSQNKVIKQLSTEIETLKGENDDDIQKQ